MRRQLGVDIDRLPDASAARLVEARSAFENGHGSDAGVEESGSKEIEGNKRRNKRSPYLLPAMLHR